jgi:hypothetical protein
MASRELEPALHVALAPSIEEPDMSFLFRLVLLAAVIAFVRGQRIRA